MALFVALIAAGPTGCEWIKGRPDVDHVEVTVNPRIIAENQTAQANGTPKKDDGTAITSSKVRVAYSTGDASVATVNPQTGIITGVAPGKAAIFAESQGKRGTDTITVVFAEPANILLNPAQFPPLTVGQSATMELDPKGINGLTLPGRKAVWNSSDTRVATVTPTGDLTARITAVSLGTAQINAAIGTTVRSFQVIVRLPTPKTVTVGLQTGKSEIRVKESQQVVPTIRDEAGNLLATLGRTIAYQSTDVTVAAVNAQTGVVTGVKEGTARITVTVDNVATGDLTLTVLPQKPVDLKFPVPTYTFRRGGRTLDFSATAFDSARIRVERPINYRSLDENVAVVTTLGLITPRNIGSTKIVASIDNLTDTLSLQVTEIPVTSIRIDPSQATANVGETRQFTATLFDSLGTQVTGRTVTWQMNSASLSIATVSASGLVTAIAPGVAQVQAFTDKVPGFAERVGAAAELIVSPTPIARVQVVPDSVSVRLGQRASIIVRTFDASGNELFNRGGNVIARSANPAVAAIDNTGGVVGIAEGKTTITFQAVNPATGLAQGTPATLIVVVTTTTPGGGDDD